MFSVWVCCNPCIHFIDLYMSYSDHWPNIMQQIWKNTVEFTQVNNSTCDVIAYQKRVTVSEFPKLQNFPYNQTNGMIFYKMIHSQEKTNHCLASRITFTIHTKTNLHNLLQNKQKTWVFHTVLLIQL